MAVVTTPNPRNARKSAAAKSSRTPQKTEAAAVIDPEIRRALIAEAAYFRAERRGFACGHEAEDWLAAEVEVDLMLTAGVSPKKTSRM